MNHRQGFVERFDGVWAIINQKDLTHFSVRRLDLPSQVKMGSYILETDCPGQFTIDCQITEQHLRELCWMSEW